MIKLVVVELKKIFKKKSIYVIWGLMFGFCLLNNILYYRDYDDNGNYKYLELDNLKEEKLKLEEELLQYNKDNQNEVTMYITIKTKLDILKLKENFSNSSWQYHKVNTYLYDIIYQINYYQYIEKNIDELTKKKEEYQVVLNKLNENNYKYFLNMEIKKNVDIQNELKKQYLNENDDKIKLDLQEQVKNNELTLKILNYRLNNDIKEDNSYLNLALESYQENYKTVKYFEELGDIKSYQDKLDYQEALSEVKISQYIVENKLNINKQNNLSFQLRTIVEDYEIFIVMLVLIVSGVIICDEFRDGTIKLLLIKPYSRGRILLSKYFTSIIVVLISILLLIAMQLIIGGIIFGLESLNIPVVVYDFDKAKLVEYSVFQYMIIRIGARMPFLLMLITISIFLGVIFSSTIISITMPLIFYMFSSTILNLASQYKLEIMKYLVNFNWNLQDYLFGRLPANSFINFRFSIIILLGYFIVLWTVTYIIFKKKDIKNI